MKKILLLTITLFFTFSKSHGSELRTSHLYSTAGAGVGATLISETLILNPAPMAFAEYSTLSYQKMSADIDNPNSLRTTTPTHSDKHADMVLITDATSKLKGGLGYQSFKDNYRFLKRIHTAFATSIDKNSSFGVSYHYSKDLPIVGNEKTYHQVTLGVLHIANNSLSIGAIIHDPFKANPSDSRFLTGFQYRVSDHVFILGDYGGNFTQTISETAETRGALQLLFLNDFFIRFGVFNDKGRNLKGDGMGISWVGPRMSLDFSIYNSKSIDENGSPLILFSDEAERLSSFGLSLIF
jgi:hypothetical protein